MERRDQKMWGGRHCRESEGSKIDMVWRCNKKRSMRGAGQKHGMKILEDVGW